jgi:hypothetical protein
MKTQASTGFWNELTPFWNAICVKTIYPVMIDDSVQQYGRKLYVGALDITNYHSYNANCAYGLISKYWIWRQHE